MSEVSNGRLPRRSWSNWLLLASSYLVTTSGLALTLALLLPDRLFSPWPWVRTDYALIAACVFLVVTLIIHLSMEQRQVEQMNEQFLALQTRVHETERRRLYALLGVSRIMGLQSDLQQVFESIVGACRDAFACDQASLMLYDPARRSLVVRAASGHEHLDAVLGSEQEFGKGVAGWVAKNRTPLILGRADTTPAHPEIPMLSRSLSAAIVVPIILRDELVGVVSVSSRSSDVSYEANDLHALEVFAENAGACIRHTEQAEWMRKTIAGLRDQLDRTREDRDGPGLRVEISAD
jgi:transcriptional regulator with GAF, ATPase, and Fis domain